MYLIRLCGAAVLALTVPARAQDLPRWQPSDCASFEANSLEAALLDCDEQRSPAKEAEPLPEGDDLEDLGSSDLPPPGEDLATAEAERLPEEPAPRAVATEVDAAEAQTPDDVPAMAEAYEADLAERERLARRAMVEPDVPEEVEFLDETEAERTDRAVVTEVEEPTVRVRPEAGRIERRRERERAREERHQERARAREERSGRETELDIPPGHLPPPGECRLWFPDRPSGHQPPPTSCDVRVPEGAVLIQG